MTSNKSFSCGDGNGNVPNDSDGDEDNDYGTDDGGKFIGDIYIPPPPPPPKFCGENTGQRLVITHIENINFKSYAGTQILGPFHKSFTSIVGPNGSGKSNVIDSMLFVFGYRAQKLRSKKLSILIHNSEAFSNLDSCRVNVHFAIINDMPGENFELIENSRFTVSRVAHKDNSSYYMINEKRVQFKDVSQLLQSHDIDLRYNRFLILQGEVEQIALMKPKADNESEAGMLEFLEDIIGTTRLKEPLAQLWAKVENMNEVRAEKFNRVKVVEKEMDSLKEAKNEAIKFLETENELTIVKSKFFRTHIADADDAKNEAQKEYDRANDIYQKAMEEINNLKKERDEKENQMKGLSKEYSAINKDADELNEKFKDCERRDVTLREKLKNTKTKGKKIDEDLEKEQKKLEDLQSKPSKVNDEIEMLTAKKEESENEYKIADENLTKVMGEIKVDTEPLQKRKDELENQLLNLQHGVNDAHSRMEIAQSELDLYLSKERGEKAQYDQLCVKLDRNISDAKAKTSALKQYEIEIPKDEKKLEKLHKDMEMLVHEKTAMNEELRQNCDRLDEIRNTAQQSHSRNRVINALMEQKRNGTLKGIYGRLGDLGAIDKKYDTAISTACGAIDNVVVDTMDNASRCVKFLKDNNIGQTTFIALDKMKDQWPDTRQYPEGVPRLFDLIRVHDERFKRVFYFAVRDTLVANDTDQATRIAYGRERHRVVTLNGSIIEKSGTMTGGGKPLSGKMGSSVVTEVDENEIRALEECVNDLRNKLSDLKEKENYLNRDIDNLVKDINIMKQNKPQYEMEVKRYDEMTAVLEKSIKDQQIKLKTAAPDPKRTKELETKLQKEKDNYNIEAKKSAQYEEEVDSLNDKIRDIMDKKVGAARKKVETFKLNIDKLNSEITKSNVSLKTIQRNIEKSKEKIKTLEDERVEALNVLTSTKESIKDLEKEARQVTEAYEKATDVRDEHEKKVKELQTKINKLKSQESKLNNENLDAKHEMEKQLTTLNEKINDVKIWDVKLKELELHDIDGKGNLTIPELTKEDVEKLNSHALQKEMEKLDSELKKMKPNMTAIAEYKKKQEIFVERSLQLDTVTKQRDIYKQQHEEIRNQRLKEFKDGFVTISRKLKEMYRMITMGGDAELDFSDSMDPFQEGINFTVRPNKKPWKKISNLSGGEKTLSSLALIFALHYYKPSPLYVMDEIDAALDFKNVSIVANYIKQRTRNTQFIIISLRNNMYELADRLVGIYKTFSCTKSVTINPSKIEEKRMHSTVSISSNSTNESPKKSQENTENTENSVFVN